MSTATILIVEDEAIVAADLANKLAQLGYVVCGIAARGEDALALTQEGCPDLILMDIRLAGAMDGVEAAEVIRREFDVPVIYLTAHSDRTTLQRAKLTEPFGYLLKPFEERELETHIEMALYKHQIERKLRESEQRYATTLASIGDAVISTDLEGRVTFMNAVAQELTGWTLAEALQKPLIEVFHIVNDHTRRAVESPVEKVFREGGVVGLANHTVLLRRDGTEIPIDDSGAPIMDANGRMSGVVLVFRDITERKQAENRLREREATLRGILDAAKESIWMFSPDGVMLMGNTTAWSRFGEPRQEIVGKHFEEFLSPELVQSRLARLKECVDSGQPTEFEDERAGMVFHHSFYPVLNGENRVTAVACFSRDITDRRRIEATQLFLAGCGVGGSGEEFFRSLAQHLAQSLEMDYVCIDRLEGDEGIAQTVAVHADGEFEDNVRYSLGDTPCGDVVEKTICCFPREVRRLYPRDAVLEKIGAESYAGIVLQSAEGRNIGLIAVIGRKPMANTRLAESILRLAALRAAHELERQQAEAALAAERAGLQAVFDVVNVGMLLVDETGTVKRVNDTLSRWVGRSLATCGGDQPGDVVGCIHALNHPEGCGRTPHCASCLIRNAFESAFRSGEHVHGVETKATLSVDGAEVGLWLEVSADLLLLEGKRHAILAMNNVTERKEREKELRNLNRILTAHSHSDQAMMRAVDESDYLQEVCRIVVEDCGHAMVWIGFAEDDADKTVRPAASAGFEEGYLDTLRITWADTERGRGPTGTAIRRGKPCECRNMLTDPKFAPWRDEARQRGYASSIVLPLMAGGRAFGAVTIYSRETEGFSDQETALLSQLADDLAFGVTALRMRAAHAQSEAALRQALRLGRSFTFEWNVNTDEALSDAESAEILGLPGAAQVHDTGSDYFRRIHPEDRGAVELAIKGLAPENDTYSLTYRMIRPDGTVVCLEEVARAFFDAQGALERVTGISADVTERIAAQETLRRSHEELERRVDERTAELRAMNEALTRESEARQRAREAASRLAAIVSSSDDAILSKTPDGVILTWNRGAERLFGYSEEEVVGRHVAFLTPGDLPGETQMILDRIKRGERIEHFETVRLTKDGARVDVSLTISPIYDLAGALTGASEIVHDITERKRMEDDLRQASEYARSLIEASLDPLVTIGLTGRITDVNEAMERMTGLVRQELVGSKFSRCFTQPEKATEAFARVLVTGMVTDFPLSVRNVSDGTTDVLYNATVYRNAAGEIQGVFAAARDITERKRMEEALRTSEKLLAEAQRIAHLGGWDWNVVTDVLSWSDEMFRLFGYAPQAFSVKYERFLESVHPEDRRQVTDSVVQALQGNQPYNVRYRVVLPDGTERVLHAQAETMFNDNGEPVRMLGTVLDITDQVRAQEEAAAHQQQLIQADKMVSLGILVSGVAHEINNPNHLIMSNVASLREVWTDMQPILEGFHKDFGDFVLGGYDFPESSAKIPDMFDNALDGSKRIQVIVDELRDFARYSPKEKMALTDTNAVVDSSVVLMSNMIKKATDRLSVHQTTPLPPVMGNRQRLEQVVINLIQNACRALPDRDRGIHVSTVYSPESNEVLIEVRDEGVGIPEEDLKHLGDPFFTRNRAVGGMGLGLWVSFNIVHEHGGTLEFHSKEGEGTRAVLSLPAQSMQISPETGKNMEGMET